MLAFGALLDPADRYIVETQVISYAPSATAYYLLSTPIPQRTLKASVLGVGGARYASPRFGELQSSLRGSGFFNASGAPRWSPIPQSLVEVTEVAGSGLGNARLLTGDEATESDLKRLPLSTFRVLHFALHSTIDEEFPDRSALILSSSAHNQEDDLLQAREILSLDLNADLVTLSACDAGAGTVEGIAGMNSLVQAFLMAGSPDAGFFHESRRMKVPKGLAARFQYCQPNECAPAFTQSTEGGDVMISRVADGVGWIKVTKFPGAVGVDIAKQIDHAIQELHGCGRLIIDLRGNAGGGLAFLRVMSYLTAERVPVGYSVTRARAEMGYSKERLAVFDHIPSQKASLIWLALKFGFRDDSVRIVTEGLGAMPFHGKAAVLVDESTTGAGERIAAFAQERKLAPVVGTRTAGRLICCSVYKVSHGYFVRIPARAWYTWSGELLEEKGIVPDCDVPDGQGPGTDTQLGRAVDVVRSL